MTRQEFVRESARSRLLDLIGDFGDVAVAQFLEEARNIDASRLDRLRGLIEERNRESNTAEQDV